MAGGRVTGSFCGFGPFLIGAMQHTVAVFGEDPALLDKIVHCTCISSDVVFAAGVAFCDGLARVTGFLTLDSGFVERQVRPFKGNTLIGRADRWIPEIPT